MAFPCRTLQSMVFVKGELESEPLMKVLDWGDETAVFGGR